MDRFSWIRSCLPEDCPLYLVDSAKDKWGKLLCGLRVRPPEQIRVIRPDVIVVTSCYLAEIYFFLVDLRTRHKIPFHVFDSSGGHEFFWSWSMWDMDDMQRMIAALSEPGGWKNVLRSMSYSVVCSDAGLRS